MDRILFIFLILCCKEASSTFTLESRADASKKIYAREGETLEITCKTDLPVGFALSKEEKLQWSFTQDWKNKSVVIGVNQIKQGGALQADYNVFWSQATEPLHNKLTINGVTRELDGRISCQRVKLDGEVADEDYVDIVVYKPVESLSIQLGDSDKITSSVSGASTEVDNTATLDFSCQLSGSNPGVDDLKVFFGGSQVKPSTVKFGDMMESDVRQYKSSVKGKITFTSKDNGKKLKCVSTDKLNNKVQAELKVKVITYDPLITCKESEGHENLHNMEVTCHVDARGLKVKSSMFRLADGTNIQNGESNLNGDKFISTKSNNGEEFDLKLHVDKKEAGNFNHQLELVVETAGDHVTEYKVKMEEIPGHSPGAPASITQNGSVVMSASIASVLIGCVLALLKF